MVTSPSHGCDSTLSHRSPGKRTIACLHLCFHSASASAPRTLPAFAFAFSRGTMWGLVCETRKWLTLNISLRDCIGRSSSSEPSRQRRPPDEPAAAPPPLFPPPPPSAAYGTSAPLASLQSRSCGRNSSGNADEHATADQTTTCGAVR